MPYKIKIMLVCLVVSMLGSVAWATINEGERGNMPDSHRAGWDVSHQTYAKSGAKDCQMCHKPKFCIECHQQRDSISQRVHKRNWKFYHSIEARANPHKCDSCHVPTFCADCHQNPR